eukprot:8851734-Pyramimonas_sp.AAC.1
MADSPGVPTFSGRGRSAIMKCSEALALDPDHFDTSFKPPSDIYDGCEQQAMKDTANLENPRFNTGATSTMPSRMVDNFGVLTTFEYDWSATTVRNSEQAVKANSMGIGKNKGI